MSIIEDRKKINLREEENSLAGISILYVEDDHFLRDELLIFLNKKFNTVYSAENGVEGLEQFKRHAPDLVLTDIKMPYMDGLKMAKLIKADSPQTPVVVTTAFTEVNFLINAIEIGIDRLIRKPMQRKDLMTAITHCSRTILQRREINGLNKKIDLSLHESLGKSDRAKELFNHISQLAESNFSIILQGETGVGKSYIARLIHKMSKRSEGPFVIADIGAIPETLIESELFGHKKGAFTGAIKDKKGFFETAHKGTLFMDELENLSAYVQSKLLLVVERKKIVPLGSSTPVDVDIRILAATNKNLEGLVVEKRFREDLYYRLNDFSITVPPLRQRREDIGGMALRFMLETADELNKNVSYLTPEAEALLEAYDWPGNVRQLKSIIRRSVFFSSNFGITRDNIKAVLTHSNPAELPPLHVPSSKQSSVPPLFSLEELEKWGIQQALKQTGGKKMPAAVLLQIGYSTLIRKMKRYNL